MASNVKIVTDAELAEQRVYVNKVASLVTKRYQDKPLACVITYGCQQNVADSEKIKVCSN